MYGKLASQPEISPSITFFLYSFNSHIPLSNSCFKFGDISKLTNLITLRVKLCIYQNSKQRGKLMKLMQSSIQVKAFEQKLTQLS